jgi:hypothetical protein
MPIFLLWKVSYYTIFKERTLFMLIWITTFLAFMTFWIERQISFQRCRIGLQMLVLVIVKCVRAFLLTADA